MHGGAGADARALRIALGLNVGFMAIEVVVAVLAGSLALLSAAVNGVTLVAVAGIVTVEAIRRLIHPGEVGGPAVLAVALVGVVVNVAASWVLSRVACRGLAATSHPVKRGGVPRFT